MLANCIAATYIVNRAKIHANMEFLAYLVDRDQEQKVRGGVKTVNVRDLPAGDVLIKSQWSSLNYKDALAATGHPGVVRKFPHIPGIDVAGVVVESSSDTVK